MPALSATVEPDTGQPDQPAVTLRITNESSDPVEILNPDLGKPSPEMNWPHSLEAYRASLLMSYGYLSISVADEAGNEVPKEGLETWATPVLKSPVALSRGESLDVPIPLGRFFALTAGSGYRLSIEYGAHDAKVRAEGRI
jgi:hypothetical protein